jgi:oxygen-independent coproporphyrinogen-3 oxidase
MMVTRNFDKIDQYIDYIEKEIHLLKHHINQDRKIIQLHWGGGTPTHLTPTQIRRLGRIIHDNFGFKRNAEVGVEIDPRELTYDHMKALRDMGFNRCSMGVQDFDTKVQETVNRIQPEDITRQTVEWSRELGYKSINLDLMYGLPYQKTASFSKTIDKVLSMAPDRLAVFNYAHLPDMIRHQKLIKDEWIPPREEKLQLLKLSIDKLSDAGYTYIGMDHFAKPEDELTVAMENGTLYRNFQGYSTHAGINLFALGITSIAMLSDTYMQNVKTLNEYYNLIDQNKLPLMRGIILNRDDIIRRDDQYFAEALEHLGSLEEDGLIEVGQDQLTVTNSGRLLIRNIAMKFDAYLMKKEKDKPQFSRTI